MVVCKCVVYLYQQNETTMETWIYIDYNYETEKWGVIEQTVGKEDKVLKSFKREADANNYELKIKY